MTNAPNYLATEIRQHIHASKGLRTDTEFSLERPPLKTHANTFVDQVAQQFNALPGNVRDQFLTTPFVKHVYDFLL